MENNDISDKLSDGDMKLSYTVSISSSLLNFLSPKQKMTILL